MAVELLTPEDVATRLKLAKNTVYIWLREGRLPGIRMGRTWRVRAEDLDAFVDAGTATSASGTQPQVDEDEHDDSVPPIWEWMASVFGDIPQEELDRVPKDAMENLDHYIYGTPKREHRE